MKAVCDTNILIDFLRGQKKAARELLRHDQPLVSLVTWMEVLVGATPAEEPLVRAFLRRFHVVEITAPIAEETVRLRRTHRLRLPDAIIWATAREQGALLVTRNTKDFPPKDPSIRVPYVLA